VSPLVRLQVFCLWLVATVPGQETSLARRGPRGRPRRTSTGTSQGVPWRLATPLGEINWTGTGLPELALEKSLAGVETHPLAARGLAEAAWRDEQQVVEDRAACRPADLIHAGADLSHQGLPK